MITLLQARSATRFCLPSTRRLFPTIENMSTTKTNQTGATHKPGSQVLSTCSCQSSRLRLHGTLTTLIPLNLLLTVVASIQVCQGESRGQDASAQGPDHWQVHWGPGHHHQLSGGQVRGALHWPAQQRQECQHRARDVSSCPYLG